MRAAALAVLVAALAVGCGAAGPPVIGGAGLLRAGDLPGWKAVPAEPGVGGLAPELGGLRVEGRVEAPALVRAGDAARATMLVFRTEADAAAALARAGERRYRASLEHAFGGAVVGRGPGAGYRLHVTRGSEPGSDTAELYVVRGGRALAVVELVSSRGFPPAMRARVLGLVRSRLNR